MSSPGAGGEDTHRGIAAAITEVSERASSLVREEIELAKAEVTQKATRLAKGAVIGIVAGVFLLTALFFFLIGCAWLLYYYLPGSDFAYFWGFFAMAVILVLLGVLAGLIAAKAVKRGAPTPDMAIEEARLIRETVSAPAPSPGPAVATSPGSPAAPTPMAPSPARTGGGPPAPPTAPPADPSPAAPTAPSPSAGTSTPATEPAAAPPPYGAATPPAPEEDDS